MKKSYHLSQPASLHNGKSTFLSGVQIKEPIFQTLSLSPLTLFQDKHMFSLYKMCQFFTCVYVVFMTQKHSQPKLFENGGMDRMNFHLPGFNTLQVYAKLPHKKSTLQDTCWETSPQQNYTRREFRYDSDFL